MRIPSYHALLLGTLLCAHANAQTIPAMDFARNSEVYEVALSPSGKHVAITTPTDDGLETRLEIVELATGKTQVLRFGKMEHVSSIVWADDDRIVLARATNEPLQPRPYSRGQLFSTNLTGDDQEVLFGYFRDKGIRAGRRKDQGFAHVVKVLDSKPGKVLVSFRCWDCGEEPDTVIYEVNAATGERREAERIDEPAGLVMDQFGRARIRVTRDVNDEPVLAYRPGTADEWLPIPESLAGYDIDYARFDEDGNTVYAEVSDHGEAARMYKLDLAAGTRTPLVAELGVTSSYVELAGRDGLPFALMYVGIKPTVQYLDPKSEYAQLHAGLMKSFPGQLVSFDGFSRDNNVVLFTVWSDRSPSAWYVYDRTTRKARLIAEARPWVEPEQLAPTRAAEFASADGLRIRGFYTAKGDGPRPLIVLPHGGPYGVYDSWGYDADTQFFASRGYGVLQVNFRGSGGRGRNFMVKGYREWGGKMQDDIAAGVRWAIDNKLADPERICTYGASYGGYAALMQPIRYPEFYKCAMGYVGVYDLTVMKDEGDINDTRRGRRYLDRVLGTDEATLIANSPARNVDKIKVPVFLAQGKIDQRVPMDQFDALVDAFGNRPVETMVVAGEGHGFYKPENRARLYQAMEAFLEQHIGEAAK